MTLDYQKEHERRFLVTDHQLLKHLTGYEIEQAYLWSQGGYAIRVRRQRRLDDTGGLVDAPAMLTAKGPREHFTRWEAEQHIPLKHATAIIELAHHRIEKTRYPVISEGNTWDVDVFHGANEGLILAEFEASPSAVAKIHKPWWCGDEVTHDTRYNNENLAVAPWGHWFV